MKRKGPDILVGVDLPAGITCFSLVPRIRFEIKGSLRETRISCYVISDGVSRIGVAVGSGCRRTAGSTPNTRSLLPAARPARGPQ